ncbi:MAG TPA: RidA family protein [Candidatus Limnocylindrales bacterium]|nr:RidA family protein [Candidatus Limnocylindrales bacterium]
MEKKAINPWTWQDRLGFVQANEVSGAARTLIVSGQTSVDDDGRPLHAGDMGAQVARAVANLETVLTAADFTLADIVKITYFTTDIDAFVTSAGAGLGRLAQGGCRPASTLIGVSRLFLPEILVEIEATAMK